MITPSANFTRPADTTAYASGDLIANSTTAASVSPLTWTIRGYNGGTLGIRRVRVAKSGVGITNCTIRVHLYTTNPCTTAPANGDNGAWSTKIAGYLGYCDVVVGTVFSDGAFGVIAPAAGAEIGIPAFLDLPIYGLLEARGAYTPASEEVFTVTLEGWTQTQ